MDAAETVVGGVERAFGRGAAVATKAGNAAAKAGSQMIATGGKLAALGSGHVSPIHILEVIEDGRLTWLVKQGKDIAACNSKELAERVRDSLILVASVAK